MSRSWNRVLVFALFVMFSLNTWLVRLLLTVSGKNCSLDIIMFVWIKWIKGE